VVAKQDWPQDVSAWQQPKLLKFGSTPTVTVFQLLLEENGHGKQETEGGTVDNSPNLSVKRDYVHWAGGIDEKH
jgi:hypothetical protein